MNANSSLEGVGNCLSSDSRQLETDPRQLSHYTLLP